jgi:hypothetical protein
MSKFKLTQSGVLGLVAGALRGWKPKRMKRALKQAKRNFKDGKCFVFDDVADSVQITNEESDEISLHPETVVHENAVEVLPAGDYTGDIAGLIDRMIADGELKDTDKLSHLLKHLRKCGRQAAADVVQMTIGRFNGDVNESCSLKAFVGMLDKSPPARRPGNADEGEASAEAAGAAGERWPHSSTKRV